VVHFAILKVLQNISLRRFPPERHNMHFTCHITIIQRAQSSHLVGRTQDKKKENKPFEIVAMIKYLGTILTSQNYTHE